MVYLLEAFGHEALQAHDGAEGIELVRTERPELVLLDIHMPRMDGYEVVRQLRRDPRCDRIPLIAITALAMVGDRERVLASGFSGYIAKPIDPEAFPAQVDYFLGLEPGKRAQRQAAAIPLETWEGPPRPTNVGVVLCVDNRDTNVDFVKSTLEPCGYQVVAAHSAQEGFESAKQMKPDLILSDVHMPYVDGYGFRRMLQGEPTLSGIPFIFLSSSMWSRREEEQAARLGTAFLARPIEPERLLAEVETQLTKGKSANG